MHVGLLDLLVIYSIPPACIVVLVMIFLVTIFVIVKKDIGHLAFSEDVRYNIQLRKRLLKFSTVAQIILFDSGVQVAFLYRCARYLHLHGLSTLAAVLHKLGKYLTNVDLPPTAKIGPGVVFLHCCNIVIGPYAEVGSHVIFRPWSGIRGWGTVKLEDGVRTGLQTIVMDCVTMGKNSESAPGAMVTQDVPANHIAYGVPAKRMVPKPETKLKGVIIELENVLLESTQSMTEALLRTVGQTGKESPKSPQHLYQDVPPAKIIYRRFGKDLAKREKALAEYVEAVRGAFDSGLRIRAHGKELIESIRARDLRVAIISSQPDKLAEEIAARFDLISSVDFICGADEFISEWKPQPWIIFRPMREMKLGVERVIYIAGSLLDLQTGIEAALRVYWVNSQDLVGVPFRGLVNTFRDLEAVCAEFRKPSLPQTL